MRNHPLLAARRTVIFVFRAFFVLALITGTLLSSFSAGSPSAVQAQSTTLVINEIDYDQPGTDYDEFLELMNVSGAAINLGTYTVELVNGSGGGAVVYDTITLPSVSLAAGDYYVICANAATVKNCDLDDDPDSNFIQNGAPDAVGLRESGTLIDAVSYEGNSGAPYTEGSGTGLEDTSVTGDNYLGISRYPNGADTDVNNVDLSKRCVTPGEANTSATTGCAAPTPAPKVVINEIDYDQPGTDTAEFLELKNTGGASVDLSTYTVELVNGSGGGAVVYQTITLPSVSLAGGDYYVICADAATVANCDLDIITSIQNGAPDAVGLRESGGLVDAVSYEGNSGAPYTEGSGTGLEDPGGTTDVNLGISRYPDGADTDVNNVDLSLHCITPGETNASASSGCSSGSFGACGDNTETPIHTIQGTSDLGSTTAASGVVVEAVVVGDFQDGTELDGFYIQEEDADADADPLTSEGLFVYDPGGTDVSVGDVVRIMGGITEYYHLTEMNSVSDLTVCSSGASVTPASVSLPVASMDDWENYEGMLINISETMVVTEIYLLGRYGEVLLAPSSRIYNFTHTNLPDTAGYDVFKDEFERSTIFLDDLNNDQNVHPIYHPQPDGIIAPGDTLRGGWTLSGVTGVLSYSWSGYTGTDAYRIHPVDDTAYEPHFNSTPNPRPNTPPSVGGRVTVASFNVLNYFTTLGSRGANTASEFNRQRAKIINAIVTMDADVIGLMEIENHPTDDALQNLVDGLNDVAGAGTYDYIATGVIGGDEIKVALIYQPARVTPAGAFAVLDDVDPFNRNTRPPLAQTFEENTTGALFTVVVNHFKSKSTDGCPALPDPNADADDGQGCWNGDRVLAANELVDWLQTDPTGSGDADYLIIGDLNSYAREDPITTLEGLGLTNLISRFEGANAYSYVFDGQWGYLDHALASTTMTLQVTGTNHWHINADEPIVLDYNEEYKPAAQIADVLSTEMYRASDHDPVLIGLALDEVITPPEPDDDDDSGGGEPGIDVFDPAISKVGVLQPGSVGLTGEKLTWTITVTNNGSAAGTDIVITDTMPVELRLDGAATERGTYSINGQTVTFTIPYLNPGESVQMWVYTTVISSPLDGVITNEAALVSGSVTDSAVGVVNVITSLPATGYPPSEAPDTRSYTGVWLALAGLLVIALGGWRLRRARG